MFELDFYCLAENEQDFKTTSGGFPTSQERKSFIADDANGVYVSNSRKCLPGDKGTKTLVYPRITSLPKKSKPDILSAIRGQPCIFVHLKVTSTGKFQIMPWSCLTFFKDVCDTPASMPPIIVQS